MSLGSDFIGGFNAVTQAQEAKARRVLEQEMQQRQINADVAKMHASFANQGQLQADSFAGQGGLLEKRLTMEAVEAQKGRDFTGTQRGLDRTQQTDERLGSEGWQGGQNDASRNQASRLAFTDHLDRESGAMEARLLAERRLTQEAGQFSEKMRRETDPANPENQLKSAQAGYYKSMLPPEEAASGGAASGLVGSYLLKPGAPAPAEVVPVKSAPSAPPLPDDLAAITRAPVAVINRANGNGDRGRMLAQRMANDGLKQIAEQIAAGGMRGSNRGGSYVRPFTPDEAAELQAKRERFNSMLGGR